MKTCTKCNQTKSDEDFAWKYKDKGRRHAHCKECQKSKSRAWYDNNKERQYASSKKNTAKYRQRNREYIWDYLQERPCVDCGESNPVVLEFDHRDPEEKEYPISILVKHCFGIEAMKKEIEKCDVRCANCHRIRTANQLGWWKGTVGA